MASQALIGRTLGNYVVRSVLGEGGMGAVYSAEHRFLGDRVAIKVLHGNIAGDAGLAQRFYLEARAARDIGHPNIIRILDFGQSDDGGLYLVMELLEGRSLSDLLAEGALDEASAAAVGAGIAEGLAAAHEKGIVHRDLKPGNVFVTADRVKVLDFGIAKIFSADTRTQTGMTFGTPAYMAPEQAKAAKHVGPPADIYALGMILYEMLTGRRPFVAEELDQLMAQVFFEVPDPPSATLPVSREMDALVLQCLEKDPEARPPSMLEVRRRLLRLARSDRSGLGQIAFRDTTPRKLVSQDATVSKSAARRLGTRRVLRWRTAQVLLGAALLSALAGAAIGRLRRAPPAPATPTASVAGAAKPEPAPIPPTAPAPVLTAIEVPARVVVRSVPEGAEVSVDQRFVGTTPTVITVTLPHQVSLKLRGYRPAQTVVTTAGEVTVKLEKERHRSGNTRASEPPAGGYREGLD